MRTWTTLIAMLLAIPALARGDTITIDGQIATKRSRRGGRWSTPDLRSLCTANLVRGLVVLQGAFLIASAQPVSATLAPDARARMANSGIVASEVIDRLDADGAARITAAIAMPEDIRPTGEENFNLDAWNAAVAAAKSEVLAQLPSGGFTATYDYKSIAAIAGLATSDAVVRLVDTGNIVRVDADSTAQATLLEAVPFVNLNATQALGFTGAGVTVAVLDTGIDRQHPNLSGAIAGEECFCSLFGQACCPNGSNRQSGVASATDDNFHGTYVSGIVAGRGITAPRGGAPAARIFALKVLNRDGQGDVSGAVAALDWLLNTRPDIKVLSMSLGSPLLMYDRDCDDTTADAMMYRDAINALRGNHAIVFAASGNDYSIFYNNLPACIHNAVSVAASYDNDPANSTFPCTLPPPAADAIACFSNLNHKTDIAAPGVNITSTKLGGGTSTGSGTSASTPLVAACAAGLRQYAPTLTAGEVQLALKSARKIHDDRTDIQYPPNGIDLPRLDCLASAEQVLVGRGLCPTTPRTNCQHPERADAARFKMSAYGTPDKRDRFYWSWKYGSIPVSDLGQPTTGTSYSMCGYDGGGQQFVSLFAPGQSQCGTRPCWRSYNTTWTYADRLLTPSGLSNVLLKAYGSQHASLLVKGKGQNLAVPRSHINAPFRVQLINNQSNKCWEATFPTALVNSSGMSIPGRISARGQ